MEIKFETKGICHTTNPNCYDTTTLHQTYNNNEVRLYELAEGCLMYTTIPTGYQLLNFSVTLIVYSNNTMQSLYSDCCLLLLAEQIPFPNMMFFCPFSRSNDTYFGTYYYYYYYLRSTCMYICKVVCISIQLRKGDHK